MPWKETSVVDQRKRFVQDYYRQMFSVAELCRRYGISRETGYKWVRRFEDEGVHGLEDRSRRPHSCAHATPAYVAEALVQARRHRPHWGAKKLLALLRRQHPEWRLPTPSTAHEILKRHGLVPAPRRRTRRPHPGRPTTPITAPNRIWTIDFKGQFKTRNGVYCYPLTLQDGFSRYLLACEGLLRPTILLTRPVLVRVFREFGLPERIRSDNGTPFASSALARLSTLAVWWVRLGIYPELIEPSQPQQNGRHERMHRTLKRETARPPAANLRAQQRRFDAFRHEFNHERPHEALDQRPPVSVYSPSTRACPSRLSPIEYPGHFEVRLVSRNGGIRWNGRWVNVSHLLAEQYVGLEEIDDGIWQVYFGPVELGRLHERDGRIEDSLGRKARRKGDNHQAPLSGMSPE